VVKWDRLEVRGEMLKVKRVYDKKEISDGKRILVDRMWPRGLRTENAGVDEWLKELSPSDKLRRWFNHDPEKWEEFRRRYRKELSSSEKKGILKRIAKEAARGDITLVYGARETEYNNARVLEEIINQAG
jgi:uncharacterized protein YeaO (DUF488 family)